MDGLECGVHRAVHKPYGRVRDQLGTAGAYWRCKRVFGYSAVGKCYQPEHCQRTESSIHFRYSALPPSIEITTYSGKSYECSSRIAPCTSTLRAFVVLITSRYSSA